MTHESASRPPGSEVCLRDGSVVFVREMHRTDATALVRFHEGLSTETIRMRYFTGHPHLSQAETERLTTLDHCHRQAFVAVSGDEIVGVGRYERTSVEDVAEVAFVVADAWQGKGLGAHLLSFVIDWARSCGYRLLTASTLATNRAMLLVFEGAGLPMRKNVESGVVDIEMSLV